MSEKTPLEKKKIKILTIEDEEYLSDMYKVSLEEKGFEVIQAEDGIKGLEAYNTHNPDIIITDIRMPKMDGIEVLEQIKAKSPDTPVIIASGNADFTDAIKAIQLGADGYFRKGSDVNLLYKTIDKAVGDIKNHRKLDQYQTGLEQMVQDKTRDLIQVNQALEVEISEKVDTENMLRESDTKYRAIFDNIQDMYYETTPNGKIIEVSPSSVTHTGFKREELIGISTSELYSNMQDANFLLKKMLQDGKLSDYDIIIKGKDGMIRPCSLNAEIIYKDNAAHKIIGSLRDISDRKKQEDRIKYLAYHDNLTGLLNRSAYMENLELILKQADRFDSENKRAVLFLDLDNFKSANDTYGHKIGDDILVEVARRLEKATRSSDYICRIGGDEFTVILSHIAKEDDPDVVAKRVVEGISRPYEFADTTIENISASVGISVYPLHGLDVDQVTSAADTAMYEAKKQGNTYLYYDTSMIKRG